MDYGIIGGADGPTAILVSRVGGGWNSINWFGVITVLLILLPNIVYAVKCRGEKNLCTNRLLNILEQIGRYGSMFFLIVYIGPKDGFGFGSVFEFLTYLFGNICLILAYWCTWVAYFKAIGVFGTNCGHEPERQEQRGVSATFIAGKEQVQKITGLKYVLAVLPAVLFLLDGICLMHFPLIICAVIFAIGHIGVTRENIKNSIHVERSTEDDI